MNRHYTYLGYLFLVGWGLLLALPAAQAQLNVNAAGVDFTISFEATLSGVNEGQFDGSGFAPAPATGQLDSDAWAITGPSDGALAFGGTKTSGDYARGLSTGSISTGGIYAFDTGANVILGFQPSGSDLTPGTITLRIQNNTGAPVTSLIVSYDIFELNNENRSTSLNFEYSEDDDDMSYTPAVALNFTSDLAGDTSPGWLSFNRMITINGLNIANGAFYYLRWTTADVLGSGSRDELGIDNITVNANSSVAACPEPANQPTSLNLMPGVNSISGSFTPATGSPNADGYIVLRSTIPSPGCAPTDGVTYTAGQTIGGCTVAAVGVSTLFLDSGLASSTTYYYFVFSYNQTGGFNCPNYLITTPLNDSATTTSGGGGGGGVLSLETQFINPCGNDGDNEFVVATTSGTPVNINDIAIGSVDPVNGIQDNFNYWWAGSNVPSGPNPTFTGNPENCGSLFCYGFLYPSIPADQTTINMLISDLNSAAGCNVFLPVPNSDLIPANANVIFFLGAEGGFDNEIANLNFNNHCSGGVPIAQYYTVIGTGSSGSGYFSNSAPRTSKIFSYDGTGSYTMASNYVESSQSYSNPSDPPCNNNDPVVITGGLNPTFTCGGACVPAPNVILPVTLLDFQARKQGGVTLITWATAGEQNNDYFAIERSLDGRQFYEIGRVDGGGTIDIARTYRFTDHEPLRGVNYYRLRQVDYDGARQYHRVAAVTFEGPGFDFQLAPVPAQAELQLSLTRRAEADLPVEVLNLAGQVVRRMVLPAGEKTMLIDVSLFHAGQYFVRVTGREAVLKRFFKL